jgi:chromosomal replication initiation ATPase DnaA
METLTANIIIKQVADLYGVSVEDVMGRKRDRIYADCRTVIFYTLCELHRMPYKHAGEALHRTHADVLYHVAKGRDWAADPRLNMDGSAAILEMECQMRHIFA